MEELLKNISSKDLEKLRLLLSILPGNNVKEAITLRVFIQEYENLIQCNKSHSYLRSVKIALNYLVEYFSSSRGRTGLQKPIDSIESKDVENFLIYLQRKVKKGYTVYYRNLKAAFNKAKEWGYVKENYFAKVKLPKRQKIAPSFVTSDQLLVICEKIKNDIVKRVVVFAFYTGMRLDEIVNLRWKNVDLINGVITVGDDEFVTKARKQRFIPMGEEARKAVLSYQLSVISDQQKIHLLKRTEIKTGFVFCKENREKFTGDYISKAFKKACKAAGMDSGIHFHSLRHSFASDLVQKGVPLYTIKELLGHSSISTTEIYSHLNMDVLREAVKKLDASTPLGTGSSTPSCVLPLGKRENSEPQIFRINAGERK